MDIIECQLSCSPPPSLLKSGRLKGLNWLQASDVLPRSHYCCCCYSRPSKCPIFPISPSSSSFLAPESKVHPPVPFPSFVKPSPFYYDSHCLHYEYRSTTVKSRFNSRLNNVRLLTKMLLLGTVEYLTTDVSFTIFFLC